MLLPGVFGEAQGYGVHAVALAGGLGAVGENVAEVSFALAALYFGSRHAVSDVGFFDDVFVVNWGPETGPAGAGIEFCVGAEKGRVATDAAEDAFIVDVEIFAGERRLGGGMARDFEGVGGQLLFPL